ncbi:unnamed protein product [Brassica oleracea var. botrytis]|uniref:Uncharacterized protein n=1 Tax=Brassica oleracea TaxID=3712 RepID=A0A3P6CDQ9_BRAOL|nr:unnamed protein product [Brassica oleracea]
MKNSTKFSINNSKIFSFIVMIILKWIFFEFDETVFYNYHLLYLFPNV